MELKRMTIYGYDFTFVCISRNTRNGFAHDCTLFYNSGLYNRKYTATCIYYNRTWEKYRYQSVMIKAVNIARDERYENLLNEFKTAYNYKRMTNERQKEFDELIKNDEKLKVFDELINDLK